MRRAERSLWILTALTVLATGTVAQILTAAPGPARHLELAVSVLLLAVSATLLLRVLRHVFGAAGDTADDRGPTTGPSALTDDRPQ